jgi:hypothetical protein
MNNNSRKRVLHDIYFTSNLDNIDYYIHIHIRDGIFWKQFYSLTKLVHSAFFRFQINPFNLDKSPYSILASDHCPEDKYNFDLIDLSYQSIKEFLTEFHRKSKIQASILWNLSTLPQLEGEINYIEYLATTNEAYTHSSIRQLKPAIKRKIDIYKTRFEKRLLSNVQTSQDLVNFFFIQFQNLDQDKKWHYNKCFNSQVSTETDTTPEFTLSSNESEIPIDLAIILEDLENLLAESCMPTSTK